MKKLRLTVLVLAALALVTIAYGDSGDTPGDPAMFTQREITFSFNEFTSTLPNDITYSIYQDVDGDSTLVATVPHVDGTLTHEVMVDIAGAAGTLNRIVVWGPDAASGLTDYCEKWVMQEEHHSNGCAVLPR